MATGTAGGHTANDAPFYQGQSNLFGNRYFDGSLSDVGLFNRALTPTEVAALYQSSFMSTTIGTVPLPASAPMFGAALLGLAGLGYAAKRRKSASAA